MLADISEIVWCIFVVPSLLLLLTAPLPPLTQWKQPGDKGFSVTSSGGDSGLQPGDLTILGKYVNSTYLSPEAIGSIRARFEAESSVLLRDFLIADEAKGIRGGLEARDKLDGLGDGGAGKEGYKTGEGNGWVQRGPSHKQRFLEYSGDGGEEQGERLRLVKEALMETGAWYRYLEALTGLDALSGHRGKIRRFRSGYDYTVAHYGVFTEESVLDATLCFVRGKGAQTGMVDEKGERVEGDPDDEVWQSGEVGGYEAYVGAEEEEEGEEGGEEQGEGRDDEDGPEGEGELLSVQAGFNQLSLCFRDWGTMRFVKYLGCKAPGSRYDVEMVYRVEDWGEEEEGEEEGEEE